MTQEQDEIPTEIDLSKAMRGLHYIPKNSHVFMPASIEESVWKYFSAKAAQKGVDVGDLLSEVLRRDIEINEALRYPEHHPRQQKATIEVSFRTLTT